MLLVLSGCGSRTGADATVDPTAPVEQPDASTEVRALARYVVPTGPQLPNATVAQCLDGPLPVGGNGLPNCIVLRARFLANEGNAEDIAACEQCSAPGLTPFIAPVPLDVIGDGLSNYQCMCAVSPLPAGAECPPAPWSPSSIAAWCYTENPPHPCFTASEPIVSPMIGFSTPAVSSALSGPTTTVYIACFEPQAAAP